MSMASAVLLEPVPAIIGTRPEAKLIVCLMTFTFSSCESVADSPDVPT